MFDFDNFENETIPTNHYTNYENQLYLNSKEEKENKSTKIRWLILFLSFLGIMCAYTSRLNLSLTIVEMTKKNKNISLETSDLIKNDEKNLRAPYFNWDAPTQGLILGSFFYTYGFLQIPGARWCEKYGSKLIGLVIILSSGLISFIIPTSAKLGVFAMITTRSLLGLAQSSVYPAFYALISKWFPEQEQSRALSFLNNGAYCGTILTMAMSGYFCEHDWFGGWPAVFYFSGFICFIWCILWTWLSASEPKLHSNVNKHELLYIGKKKSVLSENQISLTPWKKILTSKAVWSVIIVKFGVDYVFWIIMLDLPQYLNDVLHLKMYQNSLINCFLNIVLIMSNTIGGYLSDKFVSKNHMSKTKLRKSFETFSVIGTNLCLIMIPLFQESSTKTVMFLLMASMFFFGFNIGGDIPIVIDMTEHYPATIFAIANGVCSGCGFLAPLLTGFLLGRDQSNLSNWTTVFYITAAINFFCLFIFLIYGSAEPLFDEDLKKNSNIMDQIYNEDDEDSLLIAKKRKTAT